MRHDEIRSILPQFRDIDEVLMRARSAHVESRIISKVYDANKNVVDRFFEKLKTFSNTWLVVSGGIAAGAISLEDREERRREPRLR